MTYNPYSTIPLAKTYFVTKQGSDINDGKSIGRSFLTVAAATTVAVSGDCIVVYPGTYAENPGAVADGVTIHFIGNPTVGTGAGPVFTIASPATGEIVRFTGCATITATTALTVAAGAIALVDPSVTLTGVITGPWKIGRTIYLQSGNAIATFCPADGSLVAVVAGDKLYDGNTDTEARAIDVGGTVYWLGAKQQVPFESTGVTTVNPVQRCQWSPMASRKAVVVGYDGHYMQSETTTGTNYYTVSIKWKNATLATFSTQSASEDVQHRVTAAMGDVIDFADLDELADASGLQTLNIVLVESGTQILRFAISLVLREVLE